MRVLTLGLGGTVGDLITLGFSSSSIITAAMIANAVWHTVIDGYQARDLLAIIAAIAAGKTTIIALGGGLATVTFRKIDDSGTILVADMTDSERTDVTLTP